MIRFVDDYGHKCSLQLSPVVTKNRCIWLGVDKPVIMEIGWHPDFPERFRKLSKKRRNKLYASGRMHLTREQVAELLPHLQHFIETGELKGNK